MKYHLTAVAHATILALALCVGSTQAGSTPPERSGVDKFTFADVFGLQSAEDVRISPDGRLVAYTRVAADIRSDRRKRSVWLIDVASGGQRLLAADAATPRWSEDGSAVAYVAHGAIGGVQLRVSQREGAGDRLVAALPGEPSGLSWSPDGTAIATPSTSRRHVAAGRS